MILCNQGCSTHVIFINGKPYNQDGKTPHSETCLSLKFGKWWGGKENTIPMRYIEEEIESIFQESQHAVETRNIDDILRAIYHTVDQIHTIKKTLNRQAERNHKWNQEFDEYKTNLVKEQRERAEEQKQTITNGTPEFITGDKL
jgi:hypothetical protein